MRYRVRSFLIGLLCLAVFAGSICACTFQFREHLNNDPAISIDSLPPFSGEPYVVINGNIPAFSENVITDRSYERYSELDALNRCGAAIACIGKDLMPTEERGSIGQVKPTGWQTVKYDFVDGKYLYNRCHLIGFQLTGENANERNLITGTRYLNVEGMLPFENMVADYIIETGNHVLYRVTPIFIDDEMVARGVQMEALSVEDNGEGICFHVYAYNNQPGVTIDYITGESALYADQDDAPTAPPTTKTEYILNTNSKKFHFASCGQGINTKEENKELYTGSREDLIAIGFTPAGCCDP